MTNKLIKIAICWTTSAVLLYLAGSFAAASFDISTWQEHWRGLVAMMFFASSAATVVTVILP